MVYAIERNENSRGRLLPRAEELMEKAKGKKLFYRPAGKRKGMYTPTQIICVSFVIVIALGTLSAQPACCQQARAAGCDWMPCSPPQALPALLV